MVCCSLFLLCRHDFRIIWHRWRFITCSCNGVIVPFSTTCCSCYFDVYGVFNIISQLDESYIFRKYPLALYNSRNCWGLCRCEIRFSFKQTIEIKNGCSCIANRYGINRYPIDFRGAILNIERW